MNIKKKLALAKKLNIAAIIVSIVVFILVLLMRRIKIDLGVDFSFLPAVYSILNTITAILLLIALYFVKQRKIKQHKLFMLTAVISSVLFLLLYVLYHFTTPETSFCKEGGIRVVYFVLLISHIFLAALILPFILFTLIRALTDQFEKHKKMARWVFPLWLYVAITGPVIYLMLYPCY